MKHWLTIAALLSAAAADSCVPPFRLSSVPLVHGRTDVDRTTLMPGRYFIALADGRVLQTGVLVASAPDGYKLGLADDAETHLNSYQANLVFVLLGEADSSPEGQLDEPLRQAASSASLMRYIAPHDRGGDLLTIGDRLFQGDADADYTFAIGPLVEGLQLCEWKGPAQGRWLVHFCRVSRQGLEVLSGHLALAEASRTLSGEKRECPASGECTTRLNVSDFPQDPVESRRLLVLAAQKFAHLIRPAFSYRLDDGRPTANKVTSAAGSTPDVTVLDGIMKQVGSEFGALRKAIEGKTLASARDNASALSRLMSETEDVFRRHGKADGVQMARSGRQAADALANAEGLEAAGEPMRSLFQACQSCHSTFREKAPDGTYVFKPER